MPLSPLAPVAARAREAGHGLAAFNVIHLENAESFRQAAEAAGVPVVMQISQNCAKYHGALAPIAEATLEVARRAEVDVVVHLDHADNLDLVQEALDLGFSSIMYDGSKLPDAQAAYETANTLQAALLGGVNFMLHAAGWLEGGLVSSYEKFVLDADQLGVLHSLAEGIDLSENGQALSATVPSETAWRYTDVSEANQARHDQA